MCHVSFFFFFYQQFITRSMWANRGSYFCSYIHEIRADMTERRKRKKKKKGDKNQTNHQVEKRKKHRTI